MPRFVKSRTEFNQGKVYGVKEVGFLVKKKTNDMTKKDEYAPKHYPS